MSSSKLLSHPWEEGAGEELASLGSQESWSGRLAGAVVVAGSTTAEKCPAFLCSHPLTSHQPNPGGSQQEGGSGCRRGQRVGAGGERGRGTDQHGGVGVSSA